MLIKELYLNNFRCYSNGKFEFDPALTIIHGPNTCGKSTILEAIHVLGLTKPYRSIDESSLIKINELSYAIKGVISNQKVDETVIVLNSNKTKKVRKNNYVFKSLSEYVGYMNVIYYDPTDWLIFEGGPSYRRRFFDVLFCQVSKQYLNVSSEYKKLLKQRNFLIKKMIEKNDKSTRNLLEVTTKQMIECGKKIIHTREKIIRKLNEIALGIHRELSSGREKVEIKYLPNISVEEYELKMEAMLNEDLKKGTTMVGPHKDDYIFNINNKNIGDYGSQGQQKSAILSIKLASVELVKEVKNQYPIVLLDDVFSELDKGRQNQLIKLLNRKAQTIITTPSISDVEPSVLNMARIIELEKRGD